MLIMALVSGMSVLGCGTTGGETETWLNITTLNQMDGTWKATYGQTNKPIKDVMEEQGVSWNSAMQSMFGDMRVNSRADITLTINAGDKTMAMSVTSTTTYFGGNINTLWPMLRAGMEGSPEDGIEIILDDSTHSMSMAYVSPVETMSAEDITAMLSSGLKINMDGTKIKVPKDSLALGLMELIFIKQ
jgi:hypothetical protein